MPSHLIHGLYWKFAYRTGNRRFRRPEPLPPYEGDHQAQDFGPSCPQQALIPPGQVDGHLLQIINGVLDTIYKSEKSDSEDCLTINVSIPKDAKPGDNLPVLVSIGVFRENEGRTDTIIGVDLRGWF